MWFPLKNGMPRNFTFVNFGHPVSKSWLRPYDQVNVILVSSSIFSLHFTLDDQTQVDLKPAGQPEQANFNQCQLIAQNWCTAHAQLMLAIRFLCNVIDMRALIGPCSHVTSR